MARGLTAVTQVMMQLIRLLTYYAPVAFFAIFAGLVADYGPKIAGAYGRAMAVYYPVLRVPLHRLSPDGPAGRRAGRHRRHAAAHRPPGPDVSGDLLIGGPPSPPIWRRRRTPASAGTWRRWSFLWGPPCTWTARASAAC